ncbi:hypothetical protein BFZC1_00115 [Lysinibacillus fusiformis ZC1]|nr:hypothetical protein BFZC1_00115 [Lysinibacillus fusiformis ZC1]
MREQLIKAITTTQSISEHYVCSKRGFINQMRVKVIGIFGYLTFLISNVPVIIPFVYKEREVYEL